MTRAQVAAARDDVGVFATLVDCPLTATQAGALALQRRVTVIVAPRQTGKSRSLAVLALHRAFRRARTRVLIVSAGEEAAKRLLAEVRRVAAGSPILAGSVLDERSSLLTLSNGSEVRSVPASEHQVRGWSADVLLIDEAAIVDDDLILGAAFPTTAARPDARIVLASSPLGTRGAFYEHAMRGVNGSEHVATFRFRLADSPWVTAETLASLREGLSPLRAQAELDGEFVDLDGGQRLIEREWIDAACERRLRATGAGTVGLDVARFGGDRTVAYSNRGGVVRRLFVGHGWSTTQTTGRLVGALRDDLGSPPEPVSVVVDDTGVGGGVTDQAQAAGVSVRPFIGAASARQPQRFVNLRAENFWDLREAFEHGRVDLDQGDRELVEQLGELRFGYDDRGRIVIEAKRALAARGVKSPDSADAVAMSFVFVPSSSVRVVMAAPEALVRSPVDGRALAPLRLGDDALRAAVDGRRAVRGGPAWRGPRI
ncbi:hypothetical protein NBH00_14860 [Paraconexibacter antarcticus]|uniref:TcmA/NAT10 helicase domain-containing protein n=1 Tax=Paraconexibacter antarcticus TaxID=2949664 RepID=A0ABY5DN78_9ACTN|nr:terminase family protein [Paraconexibacter antarcticus]UTI62638.1 hypothetical protein NBH00_14860 [Paraconexibacter antarcticus]